LHGKMHGKMGLPNMMWAILPIVVTATLADAEHGGLPVKLDSMRIKDPAAVLGALRSLALDSDEDVGILSNAERGQMMDGLESGGVSLGDRSKVRHHFRTLVGDYTTEKLGRGLRRAQLDGKDESATNKQQKKQAEDHAGTAQAGGEQASGGVSGDSVFPYYL
jgi:hypothetical protein